MGPSSPNLCPSPHSEVRLEEAIASIHKNEVLVVDIAKLDEDMQAFVFGDTMRAVYEMKLGQSDREESEIPSKDNCVHLMN